MHFGAFCAILAKNTHGRWGHAAHDFGLSDERLRTLRAVASAQGLAIIAVPPSDFSQTLGALCALDARNPLAAPCDFAGEMLVMAGLSDAQSDRLLAALRLCLQPNIALKAVLTPANRRWTAAYLYQELCMEHAALRCAPGREREDDGNDGRNPDRTDRGMAARGCGV